MVEPRLSESCVCAGRDLCLAPRVRAVTRRRERGSETDRPWHGHTRRQRSGDSSTRQSRHKFVTRLIPRQTPTCGLPRRLCAISPVRQPGGGAMICQHGPTVVPLPGRCRVPLPGHRKLRQLVALMAGCGVVRKGGRGGWGRETEGARVVTQTSPGGAV